MDGLGQNVDDEQFDGHRVTQDVLKNSAQSIVDLFLSLLVLNSLVTALGFLVLEHLGSLVDGLLGIVGVLPDKEGQVEGNSDHGTEAKPEQASVLEVGTEGFVEFDSDLREEVGKDDGYEPLHREGNGDVVDVAKLKDVGLTQGIDIVEKSLQNSAEVNGLDRDHEVLDDVDDGLEGQGDQNACPGAHVFQDVGPNESGEDLSQDEVVVEVKDDVCDLVLKLDSEVVFKDVLNDDRVPIG
jgi:hypothetical protein